MRRDFADDRQADMSEVGTKLSNWVRFEVVRCAPNFGRRGLERPLPTTFSSSIRHAENAHVRPNCDNGTDKPV